MPFVTSQRHCMFQCLPSGKHSKTKKVKDRELFDGSWVNTGLISLVEHRSFNTLAKGNEKQQTAAPGP